MCSDHRWTSTRRATDRGSCNSRILGAVGCWHCTNALRKAVGCRFALWDAARRRRRAWRFRATATDSTGHSGAVLGSARIAAFFATTFHSVIRSRSASVPERAARARRAVTSRQRGRSEAENRPVDRASTRDTLGRIDGRVPFRAGAVRHCCQLRGMPGAVRNCSEVTDAGSGKSVVNRAHVVFVPLVDVRGQTTFDGPSASAPGGRKR